MALGDPIFVVLTVCSLIYLGWLIIGLFRRDSREQATPSLALFAMLSIGWIAAEMLMRLQALDLVRGFDDFALARIGLYCLLGQAVFVLHLTRAFTGQGGRDRLEWFAAIVFLLAAALLYENPLRFVDVLPITPGLVIARHLAAFAVVTAGWGIFIGGAALETLRTYRRRTAPLHRNRNRYWALAIMLEAAAHICALARQPLYGALLHAAAGSVMAVSLTTFNLPDLRSANRRAASYLITTLISAGLYAAVFFGIQAALRTALRISTMLLGVLLAVGLAVLFHPLLNLVQGFVQRWIMGTRYDTQQTVRLYSQSISNILDMERLAAVAIGLISESLEITHGALIVVHRGVPEGDVAMPQETLTSYELRPITGAGQRMPDLHLTARNPAVYTWRSEHHPLNQYEIDVLPRYQLMEPAEREAIAALNMDVFIPIYAQNKWIGLLAVGQRQTGERYDDGDLALLQTLADQTAVALENARLYAGLLQRNAENERLNRELQEANTELARLDQAKSDFINIASHELRTPLTQVIGYNDILAEMIRAGDVQPKTALPMAEAVRRAARRLEEIVETMFDVSKLEARTLDLCYAPVTPALIVENAIDPWRDGLRERSLHLSVKEIQALPAIVADGKRLSQVFSHLVQNAIKSTPDGGQIKIYGHVVTANGNGNGNGHGGYLQITVEDSGIGIAPEELERIFVKFYRVGNVLLHSSGETKFKGAGPGLGLTIARGIVEAHGGRIWAESRGFDEKNCPGAKFHVVLPMQGQPVNVLPKIANGSR